MVKIVKEQNYQLGERVKFDKFLVNHYMLGQSCMINNEVYTGKVQSFSTLEKVYEFLSIRPNFVMGWVSKWQQSYNLEWYTV